MLYQKHQVSKFIKLSLGTYSSLKAVKGVNALTYRDWLPVRKNLLVCVVVIHIQTNVNVRSRRSLNLDRVSPVILDHKEHSKSERNVC